jgi:hypothetical protein
MGMGWVPRPLLARSSSANMSSVHDEERRRRVLARMAGVDVVDGGAATSCSAASAEALPPWCQRGTLWVYLDPKGEERGPFDGATMASWLSKGMLPRDLRVRPARSDEYCACPPPALNAVDLPDDVVISELSAAELSVLKAAADSQRHQPVRLAVVGMTKRPPDLEYWLRHHAALGIERFYLRIEDTPELAELLGRAPWATVVEPLWANENTPTDWRAMAARQSTYVQSIVGLAAARGLTHLLHIDDDELLCVPSGRWALDASLQTMELEERALCEAHALTVEALAPSRECADAFGGVRAFRHRRSTFCAYGAHVGSAGKSVGRLCCPGLAPCGPHHFNDIAVGAHERADPAHGDFSRTRLLPPAVALILHFESASFERWRSKFTAYAAAMLDGATPTFHFPFYRESAKVCAAYLAVTRRVAIGEQHGGGGGGSEGERSSGDEGGAGTLVAAEEEAEAEADDALAHAEAGMLRVWEAWKLEPVVVHEVLERMAPSERESVHAMADHGVTYIPLRVRGGRDVDLT